MGNSRLIHHASALAALTILAACDDVPHAWSRSDIEDIAADAADDASDTGQLQGRIEELERDLRAQEADLANLYAKHNELVGKHNALNNRVHDNAIKQIDHEEEYRTHRHY